MGSRYDWYKLSPIDFEALDVVRSHYHVAIQNVAVVGRTFLEESEEDKNAVLHWVPGLWRMAGKWVTGEETFRSSICLENFHLYLVNEKVNTLGDFPISGKRHTELMLWLEEQIAMLNLAHGELSVSLPYDLPDYPMLKTERFQEIDLVLSKDFGGMYHNAFKLMTEMRDQFANTSDIVIWPHHFDQAMKIILKDTGEDATNTFVAPGFSPGDNTYPHPYYYVNSWPYADASRFEMNLPFGEWHSEHWSGAVLPVSELWSMEDQQKVLEDFYYTAVDHISTILLA